MAAKWIFTCEEWQGQARLVLADLVPVIDKAIRNGANQRVALADVAHQSVPVTLTSRLLQDGM